MSQQYDLIILGGGPAGYGGALRAAQNGLNVALIEQRGGNELGGTCLNEGCIPSKAFLQSSKVVETIAGASKYGVTISGEPHLNLAEVVKRKNEVRERLRKGIAFLMKTNKITVIEGVGKLDGQQTVVVDEEKLQSQRILLAAGSVPFVPPISGVELGHVQTSTEILDCEEMPTRLVIIGGGYIGLEFASFFAGLGPSVTVVEMMPEVIPNMDTDIAAELRKGLKKRGVQFKLKSKVTNITPEAVTIETGKGTEQLPADRVLVCIGRKPYTSDLGLDSVGVLVERGAVPTDKCLRTNVPGIWAAGDINGKYMLAHVATREAEVAVENMLGMPTRMSYGAVPGAIYTYPEVMSVGHTRETATAAGLEFEEKTGSLVSNGRFLAETEFRTGMVKLLVTQAEQRLIGVHMVGLYATEILHWATTALETRLRIEDIDDIIFAHPTVGEALRGVLVGGH